MTWLNRSSLMTMTSWLSYGRRTFVRVIVDGAHERESVEIHCNYYTLPFFGVPGAWVMGNRVYRAPQLRNDQTNNTWPQQTAVQTNSPFGAGLRAQSNLLTPPLYVV